jgi:hypothetical protein
MTQTQTTTKATVRDLIDGKLGTRKVFIKTAWGLQEVTGIRMFSDGPWVVCGKENGGFGKSYCVCYDAELEVAE